MKQFFYSVPIDMKILMVIYMVTSLTLPMPKGRGFLVAAERYRLTSSFLIGRTPS